MKWINSEVVLASAFFWILAMLALPISPTLLDVLLAVSLTVSLLILLVAINTERPLDFSVFPSLLLIVTLLRLGLNVASTRLILLKGNEGGSAAGHVIEAFGSFAVGGNYVVGFVVFLIFLVINFVVITKGAGRIAEVAARFTLDSMPGKQMAIDADLNHGVLDDQQARIRRNDLQRETDFYGAMDGASKFVRGDAIAGLVIMAVNVLGGLGVGVLQNGMRIGEALASYTILTVGDGLVSQIPGLIVSTAAGMVVTRAGGSSRLAFDLRDQLILQPRSLTFAAVMLGTLALVPGLPFLPFALLGGATGWLARHAAMRQGAEDDASAAPVPVAIERDPENEVRRALDVDELELEIGYQLVSLADPSRGGELLSRIRAMRRQVAADLGFVVPLIHVRDNVQLGPDSYSILLRGNPVASGEVPSGRWLALKPSDDIPAISGIETRDAAFGLPALWIRARDRDRAAAMGYAVVDAATAITTHLSETIRAQPAELLSRRHVQELLAQLGERAPKVVEEIVPALVPVSVLHRTLRQLLAERVSIRDLEVILETLADHASRIQDADALTDLVRQRLARTLTKTHLDANGALPVLTLDASLEERLRAAVQRSDNGLFFSLDSTTLERLIRSLEAVIAGRPAGSALPALLCPASIRAALRQVVGRIDARLPVLSHAEIPPDLRLVGVGTLRLGDAH